jgi:hypothetical protein
MVNFALLQLIVKDAILERLEYLVPDIEIDVQSLHSGHKIPPNQLALQPMDIFQKLCFEYTDKTTLILSHQLHLLLANGFRPRRR